LGANLAQNQALPCLVWSGLVWPRPKLVPVRTISVEGSLILQEVMGQFFTDNGSRSAMGSITNNLKVI
jgi:hypothetical protein